ncbi:MAG: hypothetical protein AAGG48_00030 [Planctomycetota bacterium]
MAWKLFLSNQASLEIDGIWSFGLEHFGRQIADDYDDLIQQALRDLLEDPQRLGCRRVSGFSEELYTFHLRFSNDRAGGKIKNPSHAVFFYLFDEQTIAVASISREVREFHLNQLERDKLLDEMRDE